MYSGKAVKLLWGDSKYGGGDMWENVGAAMIYGAIGGGGALIGGLLALPFRNSRIGSMVTAALAAGGAVLGYNFAEPLLKPYIGQYLPASPSDDLDAQIETMIEELNDVPTFAAILKKDPEMRGALKRKLREIAQDANSTVAGRQMAFSSVFNEVQGRLIYFLKRGRDDDLLAYYRQTNDILVHLSVSDPKFCYESSYNPAALIGLDLDAIKLKHGEERYNRNQELGARLVENAYDDIPDYDVEEAQAALVRATQVLLDDLGEENIGMITGVKAPSGLDDYKLVCDATIATNNSLLGEADAASAIRHVFVISG